MMHPMRVEWAVPDEAKREAARHLVERDIERSRTERISDLHRSLVACSADERSAILSRRYPDLVAEVVHYGTLLSIRYVPSHLGYEEREGSLPRMRSFAVLAKWVALVATADGTRQMDPTKLRVMWPMSAGDPIGGVVSADELVRRARPDAA